MNYSSNGKAKAKARAREKGVLVVVGHFHRCSSSNTYHNRYHQAGLPRLPPQLPSFHQGTMCRSPRVRGRRVVCEGPPRQVGPRLPRTPPAGGSWSVRFLMPFLLPTTKQTAKTHRTLTTTPKPASLSPKPCDGNTAGWGREGRGRGRGCEELTDDLKLVPGETSDHTHHCTNQTLY